MNTTELNENLDFDRSCRICLNQTNELISIFDHSSFEISYSTIINECVGVRIYENDELPKNICSECVEYLNKFYKFRKLAKNSEHRLCDFLNKVWNNLNKDLTVENMNNIKEENLDSEFNGQLDVPTCSIKSERDPLGLEDDSEFQSNSGIVRNECVTDKNETHRETTMMSDFEGHDTHGTLISGYNSYLQAVEEEKVLKVNKKVHRINKHKCLSSHLARYKKHNKIGKPYICNYCNKTFNAKYNLEIHERTHSGEKPYTCKVCGKSFTQLGNLKAHEMGHKGEKPFNCEQCGKAFITKAHLQRHQLIHTGEKPYNCDECGKSFGDLSHLKRHERIHTAERPHHCKQCGMSFTKLSHLKIHTKIHKGGKTYNCQQCDKPFSTRAHLKRHELIHTGERPYICKHCGKSFGDLSHLKRHERRIHTGDTPHNGNQCGISIE